MQALFRFLWRYYPFFLFVLLEIVALRIVVSGGYQSSVFSTLYHTAAGTVYEQIAQIKSYFYLEHDNAVLLEENNRLKEEVQSLKSYMQSSGTFMPMDSMLVEIADSSFVSENKNTRAYFEFMPAQVIHNEITHLRNYLMLNKGSADGVTKNMGVVNAHGLVGVISDVSEHFCTVLPVLNTNVSFSVLVQPSGELCSMHWDGEDSRYAALLHLERSAQISVGDTVVSSGYSHIFPKNIMAGKVSAFEKKPDDFKVQLELSVDFSRLHHVHIVRNPYYYELQVLKKRSVE